MTKKVIEVDFNSLKMLEEIAVSVGEEGIESVVKAVIADLQDRSPYDLFADVLARHVWDEFSWCREEGLPMDNLEAVVRSRISAILNNADDRNLVSLTAYSQDRLGEVGEGNQLEVGVICTRDIEHFVYQRLQEASQARHISILGHNRADELEFYLVANGVVFSELPDEKLSGALVEHFEDIICSDGDLSDVANSLARTFLEQVADESESFGMAAFLGQFESDVRALLVEKDILPDLKATQCALLVALDPPAFG